MEYQGKEEEANNMRALDSEQEFEKKMKFD